MVLPLEHIGEAMAAISVCRSRVNEGKVCSLARTRGCTVKPIEDVREISALTYGFIASKALFAAVELDLFTKIAGGADTLSTIAEATGVAANRARTLLTHA